MKKSVKTILSTLLLASLFAFTSINKLTVEENFESMLYGDQTVMTTNLKLTKFKNGEDIPQAKSAEEWERAGENKKPAWTYYNNDSSTAEQCGLLYNWFAVNDPRGLAPEGWHIPSEDEWKKLGDFFSQKYPRNVNSIKSKTEWTRYENGDNTSGFNAFPCGYRSKTGSFNQFGGATAWWSASKDGGGDRSHNSMFFSFSNVYHEYNVAQNNRASGLSVRCMKD